ncbi:MAG: hypothetical protein CUN55_11385 [Phototrophicales bacterium]|nr:MAG: hypothetical protein CUN55_11385 [Phototrophicales bacterium]
MAKQPQKLSTFLEQVQYWVDGLPRGIRIGLNALISLFVIVVLGLFIVFLTAGDQVNEVQSDEVLYVPTITITVLWIIIYGFGWRALVGFDLSEDQEWRASRISAWVVLIGMLAFILTVLGCIFGLLFATLL